MFAIFESLGRQYKVSVGDVIRVDRISENNQNPAEGTNITFTNIIMLGEDSGAKVGAPFISGASITAELVDQGKEKKVIAFKKKRRKGYHRKVGFRRQYTELLIKEIKAA